MDNPKYKTLAELKYAIDNKELDMTGLRVTIDNDHVTLWEKEVEEEGSLPSLLFDGGFPEEVLKEALDLLGIPNKSV
jgi:hypothetical protein